ncbi:MAG: hypothetical protein WC538_24330 [Thermoanaerobaculia bacterium]|jgi:hypothetical protein
MTEETLHEQEPQAVEEEPLEGGLALILEQVEEMVPPIVRTQVTRYPFTFLLLGLGVGIFLGAKKGDELLSAGTSMLTAAVAANFNAKLGGDAGD